MKVFGRERVFTAVVVFTCLILFPTTVLAHLVTTGMGPVYDGTVHLLLTPEDFIPVLAIAVYSGLQGREYGRYILFVLPLTWFLGGMVGFLSGQLPALPYGSLSFLLFGILISINARIPLPLFLLLAAAFGTMHGFFNGQAMKTGPGVLGMTGIIVTIFVLVAIISALVSVSSRYWVKIILRVMGSWVAASGLLMVGWFIRDYIA